MSHCRLMLSFIVVSVLLVPMAVINGGCSHNRGLSEWDKAERYHNELMKKRDMIIVQIVDLPDEGTVIKVSEHINKDWNDGVIYSLPMKQVANQPGFFTAQVQVYSEVEFWIDFFTEETEAGKAIRRGTIERYCGPVRFFAGNGSEEEYVTFVAIMERKKWVPFRCRYLANAHNPK